VSDELTREEVESILSVAQEPAARLARSWLDLEERLRAEEWYARQLTASAEAEGCKVSEHDGGMHPSGRRNPNVWNDRADAAERLAGARGEALAKAAIPLEALAATECDPAGKALAPTTKAGILAAVQAVRAALSPAGAEPPREESKAPLAHGERGDGEVVTTAARAGMADAQARPLVPGNAVSVAGGSRLAAAERPADAGGIPAAAGARSAGVATSTAGDVQGFDSPGVPPDALAAAERRGMERAAALVCARCRKGERPKRVNEWSYIHEDFNFGYGGGAECPAQLVWRALGAPAGEGGRDAR